MRVAFLTESRADWGGIKPVMLEFIANHAEIELWIVGEHLERGTAEDVLYEIRENFRDSISKVKFATKPEEISESKAKWLFVLGDRKNVFPFVISAWEKGIKIAHISGGDFQRGRLVDEKIRNCISEFADIHFPSLEESAKRLAKRFDKSTIYNVGSPFISDILKKTVWVFREDSRFFLIQIHPEDRAILYLKDILHALRNEKVKLMMPNCDRKLYREEFVNLQTGENVEKIENLERTDFLDLLWDCECFIGNSSSMFLEAQYLGVPCLHVGERNLGRQEAFPVHNVHFEYQERSQVGNSEYEILQKIIKAKNKDCRGSSGLRDDYKNGAHGDGSANKKIWRIINENCPDL